MSGQPPVEDAVEAEAVALERLISQGRRAERSGDMEALSAAARQAMRLSAGLFPEGATGAPLVGFDRPATLYLTSGNRPAALAKLRAMIAARPHERHLVLFTTPDATGRVPLRDAFARLGAGALWPPDGAGSAAAAAWVLGKVEVLCAQRLVVDCATGDLVGLIAAGRVSTGYGARLYLVHPPEGFSVPADLAQATVVVPGADAAGARDAAIWPRIRAGGWGWPAAAPSDCPPWPLPDQLGRRARLRLAVARGLWPARCLWWAAGRLAARSGVRHALAAPRAWVDALLGRRRRSVAASASLGTDAGWKGSGAETHAAAVVALLTGGAVQHVVVGTAAPSLRSELVAALDRAGIDRGRVLYEVRRQLGPALARWRPRLVVLGSRAQSDAALPLIVGAGAGVALRGKGKAVAPGVTMWDEAQDLGDAMVAPRAMPRDLASARVAALAWNRIVTRVEMPATVPRTVPAEDRARAITLFDAKAYLASLPPDLSAEAKSDPVAHYLTVGEALGHAPHPLFDPVLCGRALARQSNLPREGNGRAVLLAYLSAPGRVQPHSLIEPGHLAHQPGGAAALASGAPSATVLASARASGLPMPSPHPLLVPAQTPEASGPAWRRFARRLRGVARKGRDSLRGFGRPPALFGPGLVLHPLLAPLARTRFGAPGRAIAPDPLWACLIEGNVPDRSPHPLLDADWVEAQRPGTLADPVPVALRLLLGDLQGIDPHPLVSVTHLRKQLGGTTAGAGQHPLLSLVVGGCPAWVDPHPWFSSRAYRHAQRGADPSRRTALEDYLTAPLVPPAFAAPFLDAHFYVRHYHGAGTSRPALVDYAKLGAGLFWPVQPMSPEMWRLSWDTASALMTVPQEAESDVALLRLLQETQHPRDRSPHPTLRVELRELRVDGVAAGASEAKRLLPPREHRIGRPSIVASEGHPTFPGGRVRLPGIEVALHEGATVVAGNDGFLSNAGLWIDPGMQGFDAGYMTLKGNGALFAFGRGRGAIRRHDCGVTIDSGIFCCGTYSRNYYHFMVETLPRALYAADVAPPGIPVLVDDDMPPQHYQALALYLPDRKILRLARQRSHRIGHLWVCNMPSRLHDAYGRDPVPVDSIALDPEVLGRLARLAPAIVAPGTGGGSHEFGRRLYLRRESEWRKLLNADEIERALTDRGFEILDCARLDFADQVRAFAGADEIVGQSGAHFGNLLFARAGSRAHVLFSDAPATPLHLWSSLGEPLGVRVVNVVGARVPGAGRNADVDAHADFSASVPLVAHLFPLAPFPASAKEAFDGLQRADAETDARTAAWSVVADGPEPGHFERIAGLRRGALSALDAISDNALAEALAHPLFADPVRPLTCGLRSAGRLDAIENKRRDGLAERFAQVSGPVGEAAMMRLLAEARLLLQPWQTRPLVPLDRIPTRHVDRYLRWLCAPPYLPQAPDPASYLAYLETLLDWFAVEIDRAGASSAGMALRRALQVLDLGPLYLLDVPVRRILDLRARILDGLLPPPEKIRQRPRPGDGREGPRRIGILCRSFRRGPDSDAVLAMVRDFDPQQWLVHAYSVEVNDRVVQDDPAFARDFARAVPRRRTLPPDPQAARRLILADDLDLFVQANATSFGFGPIDQAIHRRFAPRQAVMNSHLPVGPGSGAFDVVITGESDHPDFEVPQDFCRERLVRLPGPVISHVATLSRRATLPLDRVDLGLGQDETVLMNAGSMQKLGHACLTTMMRATRAVPNARLVLAPYNPGWASRSLAMDFHVQLQAASAETGLAIDRILVLGELSVPEAEAALACADIYLNPFPHGGATMTRLALVYGVPPVTLRRRSLRSVDQFLLADAGLSELLADTPDDYVALVAGLAADPARRRRLAERMAKVEGTSAAGYSRMLSEVFAALLDDAATPQG